MLELLYAPKIHCPKQRVVSLSLPTYQVSCEILANPMVDIGNISWNFQNFSKRIGDQNHDNRVIQVRVFVLAIVSTAYICVYGVRVCVWTPVISLEGLQTEDASLPGRVR